MAHARMRMKLKGFEVKIGDFEIEVVGERGELPQQLKAAAAGQVRNLLAPATQVIDAQIERLAPVPQTTVVAPVVEEKRSARRSGARSRAPNAAAASADAAALNWKPDIQRYGNPTDDWATADRAMWLLGCYAKDHAENASAAKGLSQPGIIAIFTKHFPHLREIQYSNLKRDMKKLARAERPKVHADRTLSPAIWSLTEVGTAYVDDMIKRATAPTLSGVA